MEKKIHALMATFLVAIAVQAQNVGIGTKTPNYPLTVMAKDSKGIVQKMDTMEVGFFTNEENPTAYVQTWSNNSLAFATGNGQASLFIDHPTGNIGLGNIAPAYKLDVTGAIRSTGNAYFSGAVGIGTVAPNYKLQINNGALALYSEADSKSWYFNYTTNSGGYFYLAESGVNRLTVANGGNVGIGTSAPSVKLDVIGAGRFSGNLTVGGAETVAGSISATGDVTSLGDIRAAGNLTAHGGGVIYNTTSPSNLKFYTRTADFFVTNLAPHTLSAEGIVNIGGGFTVPPSVYVGEITSASTTAGPLYQLQLVTYGSTAGSFKVRILNNSDYAITQNITWNVMCIGY